MAQWALLLAQHQKLAHGKAGGGGGEVLDFTKRQITVESTYVKSLLYHSYRALLWLKVLHPLLAQYSSTKWGEGRGRLFEGEGGAYFKFWLIGGAFNRRGRLFGGRGLRFFDDLRFSKIVTSFSY